MITEASPIDETIETILATESNVCMGLSAPGLETCFKRIRTEIQENVKRAFEAKAKGRSHEMQSSPNYKSSYGRDSALPTSFIVKLIKVNN